MSEGIRINKYLSEAGVCSRRAADRLIADGQVTVDGVTAELGTRVFPGQQVLCRGKAVKKEEEEILLLCNKPPGIVCTAEKREKNNIVDFIGYPKRIYPVGRLDKDSRGLILLTNVGELSNGILRARYDHEKEYIVKVRQQVTGKFLRALAAGVLLSDPEERTRPCRTEYVDEHTFRIILTEGKNRQIRRMCAAFGVDVADLQRVRIMNFTLDGIKEGTYRKATKEEWEQCRSSLLRNGSKR